MRKTNRTYVVDSELALKLSGLAWLERKSISRKLDEILTDYFKQWDKSHIPKVAHIIEDDSFKEYVEHKNEKYRR